MTTKEARELGIKHAEAGKQCTPHDCQTIDKMLLDLSKSEESPAKFYAKMCVAYNSGWQEKHFEMVSS